MLCSQLSDDLHACKALTCLLASCCLGFLRKAWLGSVPCQGLLLVADGWTREQKDHCLEETEKAFSVGLRMSMKPLPGALHRLLTSRSVLQYAGGLMRCITE